MLTEIISLKCSSAIWGWYPVSFISLVSSELTLASGYNLMAGRWQVFSFLSVLGADAFTLEG